jgi:2-keto-4-pentenoate hydratase
MSYPTADFAADSRVERGMRAQLERRAAMLAGGEEALGWKVGFGNPPSLERFGTNAPMVGFLLRSGLVEPGALVSLAGWSEPAVEAEVAVQMGADLPPGAGPEAARAAIGAIAPAFELADIDPPPEDVEAILAANIFQRAVMLGERTEGGSPEGLSATIVAPGSGPIEVADTEAATGEIVPIVRHVAELVGAFGERLSAGEIVITGALVPPIPVSPGDRLEYELHGLGRLSIGFGD